MSRLKKTLSKVQEATSAGTECGIPSRAHGLRTFAFAVLGIGAAVMGAWGLRVGDLRRIASSSIAPYQTQRQSARIVFEWVEDPLTPEQYKAAAEAALQGGCIEYSTGHYRVSGYTLVNDPATVLARAKTTKKDNP